jgi:hypothetical protein
VVLDRGASIVVCNEKEYTTAKVEGQEPEGIGFPRDAVEEIKRMGGDANK